MVRNNFLNRLQKTIKDTNQKILKKTRFNTKATESLDEWIVHEKTLKLFFLNTSGVNHSYLIRPIAKLLEPKNKNQFRFNDDPDKDKRNNKKMNNEKVTIYWVSFQKKW